MDSALQQGIPVISLYSEVGTQGAKVIIMLCVSVILQHWFVYISSRYEYDFMKVRHSKNLTFPTLGTCSSTAVTGH